MIVKIRCIVGCNERALAILRGLSEHSDAQAFVCTCKIFISCITAVVFDLSACISTTLTATMLPESLSKALYTAPDALAKD